VRIAFIEKLKR